jgi:hypothetical protein
MKMFFFLDRLQHCLTNETGNGIGPKLIVRHNPQIPTQYFAPILVAWALGEQCKKIAATKRMADD